MQKAIVIGAIWLGALTAFVGWRDFGTFQIDPRCTDVMARRRTAEAALVAEPKSGTTAAYAGWYAATRDARIELTPIAQDVQKFCK